jgi:8-oxo-dGTP diphosphatase
MGIIFFIFTILLFTEHEVELNVLQIMQYVVGFLFNVSETGVVLIRKNKPKWQAGLLNGVGGKIEEGESPLQAMTREWLEETKTTFADWTYFCKLEHSGNVIYFFKGKADLVLPPPDEGAEIPDWTTVSKIMGTNSAQLTIRNLKWLIPLALDVDIKEVLVIDKSVLS